MRSLLNKRPSSKLVAPLEIFKKSQLAGSSSLGAQYVQLFQQQQQQQKLYVFNQISIQAKMTARQMQGWGIMFLAIPPKKPTEDKLTKTATLGQCLISSAPWLRSMPATSCQWLLTLQQCGSSVGKRLLVQVPLTAFNEQAALAATNQRNSTFLSATQRLHQTTRPARGTHSQEESLTDWPSTAPQSERQSPSSWSSSP